MPQLRPEIKPEYQSQRKRQLAARLEPFDSFWQTPEDPEVGYERFGPYNRANYLPHLPADKSSRILVVSCGPGYLVKQLVEAGYSNVLGIDSDPDKIAYAQRHQLPCQTGEAFVVLGDAADASYDAIVAEQEINHLTYDETVEFLRLCHTKLKPGGRVVVCAINSANPIFGTESRAMNIDHFYTTTEYSMNQLLTLGGFVNNRPFPLKLYVYYGNPLNYIGLIASTLLDNALRVMFMLYGKKVKILTKKIGAVGFKPTA